MTTSETVMKLMDYFACTYPRRLFGPRDFNSQVMAQVFDPRDRATLGTALEVLVEDGVLERCAPVDFRITDAGLALLRQLRQAKALRDGKLVPV